MSICYRILSSLFILLLLSGQLLSQDQGFERIYVTEGTDILSTSLHEYGSGYVVLSVEINDIGERPYVHLMTMDSKGTIDWSMQYDYGEEDIFIAQLGEVEVHENGDISFGAYMQKDSLNRVVTRVSSEGDVLWSIATGEVDGSFSGTATKTSLLGIPGSKALHVSALADGGVFKPLVSLLSPDGTLLSGEKWSATTANGVALSARVRDMVLLGDSTVLAVGNTQSADHQLFLTKMDTLGQVIWSRSYTADIGGGLSQTAISVTEMVDSTIMVLGAQAGGNSNGILLHVDADGNYIESRMIATTNPVMDIYPIGIDAMEDTTVAIGLKRLDLLNNQVSPVIVRFDMDSVIRYESIFKPSTDILPTEGGFVSLDSMTATFLTSTTRVDSVTLSPYLIKVRDDGTTLCNERVDFISFDSIGFLTDTIIWTMASHTEHDTIPVVGSAFEFNPPILSLRDTTYCPEEPIMFTLDATTRGATAYLWDDGNTDSIRVVTEAGQYIVTVQVGIEECFTLCDTANITQKMLPMVDMASDPGAFCDEGTITLSFTSSNPVKSIRWSNGATTPTITVSELRPYSVTIVDDCDKEGTASFDLSNFRIENSPVINVSGENLCTDNSLLLVASGNFDVNNLIWYRGNVGSNQIAQGVDRISVAAGETGLYSLENLEQFCPGSASVQIVDNQFLTPLTVEVEGRCVDPNYTLTATSTGAETIQWDDQTSNPTRVVNAPGDYAIIATDICGNTETARITVSQSDLDNCGDPDPEPETTCTNTCVKWPNGFYPGSDNQKNRTFGPDIRDCSNTNITEYSLEVYNRWGELVFESDSVDNRWNGRRDNSGDDLSSDTYFYYATYTLGNESCNKEGDITLIR